MGDEDPLPSNNVGEEKTGAVQINIAKRLRASDENGAEKMMVDVNRAALKELLKEMIGLSAKREQGCHSPA